jgi:hypothetical protein
LAAGSLRDDGDAKLSVDLGMQPDRDDVLAGRPDWMIQLDPTPVDRVTLPAQGISNVLRCDGAEELPFLTGLA